jgi:hypothetical protein
MQNYADPYLFMGNYANIMQYLCQFAASEIIMQNYADRFL